MLTLTNLHNANELPVVPQGARVIRTCDDEGPVYWIFVELVGEDENAALSDS